MFETWFVLLTLIQYLRQTEKLMRQLQGMNIKSMLVLKIVSIASKYKHWIKNCLAFLPSEFLIDNQIINATKIGRPHVRAALLLAKVLKKTKFSYNALVFIFAQRVH